MKSILGLFLIGLIGTSCFGQDSTKVKSGPKIQEKQVETAPGSGFPSVSFRKSDSTPRVPHIKGNYIIERHIVEINSTDAKESMKVVGNRLSIDEINIIGEEMDTIAYAIYESEMMDLEDYLFRIFGEVPTTIPDDLPRTILVHKTDNLACYGIAEAQNGLVLIPYNGLLLYLRRY